MNDYSFTCPHCKKRLKASADILGKTVKCPSCKEQITIPEPAEELQVVEVVAPQPMSTGREIPETCPLCGRGKHMNDIRMLYGHVVCKKCYYSFANRRQFAYFLDILGYWVVCFIAGIGLGIVMVAGGSTQSEIQNAVSAINFILLPFFCFKDCFYGQSIGKAICGVKVIKETTGKSGGLGASFMRNLPLVIPFMPLLVAVQLCKGHRIGDGWSNTKVIWKKYADLPIFAPVPLNG